MVSKILIQIENHIKEALKNDKSGHDYEHSKRVLKNALKIAKSYSEADKEIIIAACWLHDIAFKEGFVKEHHKAGVEPARKILIELNFPKEKIEKVCKAVLYHAGNIQKEVSDDQLTIEDKILRDADNIDAFGSIGLVRMISFCRDNSFPIFVSKEDRFDESIYGGVKGVIGWEKAMFTPEGKKIAKPRIKIMRDFLKKLEKEMK